SKTHLPLTSSGHFALECCSGPVGAVSRDFFFPLWIVVRLITNLYPTRTAEMAWTAWEMGRSSTSALSEWFCIPISGRAFIQRSSGVFPVWSRDGSQLFYFGDDRKRMMAVDVKAGTTFETLSAKPLFDVHLGCCDIWFDVAKDGRFLIPTL